MDRKDIIATEGDKESKHLLEEFNLLTETVDSCGLWESRNCGRWDDLVKSLHEMVGFVHRLQEKPELFLNNDEIDMEELAQRLLREKDYLGKQIRFKYIKALGVCHELESKFAGEDSSKLYPLTLWLEAAIRLLLETIEQTLRLLESSMDTLYSSDRKVIQDIEKCADLLQRCRTLPKLTPWRDSTAIMGCNIASLAPTLACSTLMTGVSQSTSEPKCSSFIHLAATVEDAVLQFVRGAAYESSSILVLGDEGNGKTHLCNRVGALALMTGVKGESDLFRIIESNMDKTSC